MFQRSLVLLKIHQNFSFRQTFTNYPTGRRLSEYLVSQRAETLKKEKKV